MIDKKYWRRKLLKQKQSLAKLEEISAISRGSVTLDQQKVGRLSRMDALQEQAMNQAVSSRRQQTISRIDAALKRLDEDEYGFCLTCGELINTQRLELDPTSINCFSCQR